MNNSIRFTHNERSHYILTFISLFLLCIYFYCVFVVDNLHHDGLVYSSISRNMSMGLGTTWHPAYSGSQYFEFYEHPALGLWLGSLFFKFFGDYAFTEKIFSSIIALINIYYLIFYWKRYVTTDVNFSNYWVVILSWFLVPLFIFYYPSNLLEMLANTFALPSIHLLIKTLDKQHTAINIFFKQMQVAGLLVIAFLINGPLTLFPLAFYLIRFFVYRDFKGIAYIKYSIQLLFGFILILGVLCYFNVGLYQNLKLYLSSQLFSLFDGSRTDASIYGLNRLLIIRQTFNQFTGLFFLTLTSLYLYSKVVKKERLVAVAMQIYYKKELQLFFFIALISLLPITLSSKQFNHYTLQSCFFLQLCFLLHNTHIWLKLIERLPLKSICLSSITIFFFSAAFLYFDSHSLSSQINTVYMKLYESLDEQNIFKTYNDSQKIGEYLLGKSKTIAAHNMDYVKTPRIINTYLIRRYKMSITQPTDSKYLIIDKRKLWLPNYQAQLEDTLTNFQHAQLLMDLNLYKLYKLK